MKIIVDTNIIIGALIKRSGLLFTFLKICRDFEILSPISLETNCCQK